MSGIFCWYLCLCGYLLSWNQEWCNQCPHTSRDNYGPTSKTNLVMVISRLQIYSINLIGKRNGFSWTTYKNRKVGLFQFNWTCHKAMTNDDLIDSDIPTSGFKRIIYKGVSRDMSQDWKYSLNCRKARWKRPTNNTKIQRHPKIWLEHS